MRVVCLFASVLGLAGAVNLAHAPQLEIKDRSPFATAVLAELNTHLSTGGPADELLKIVTDIRTRITEAGTSDDAGWATRDAQCVARIAEMEGQKSQAESDLVDNLAAQDVEVENIKAAKADVVKFAGEEKTANDAIVVINQTITTLNLKRAYEKEVFENRTKDTEECIAAVKEIIELDGNQLLDARQHDTDAYVKDQYGADSYSNQKSTTVNDVAISAQNGGGAPRPDGLLAITSKLSAGAKDVMSSMASADANYDDLANLLNHLAEELARYKSELKTTEDTAFAQHASDVADLEAERVIREEEEFTAQKNKAAAFARQQIAEGELARLEGVATELRQLIADLTAAIQTWNETCTAQKAEYVQRGEDRADELTTLGKIEDLINEKLGHLLDASERTNTQADVHAAVADA